MLDPFRKNLYVTATTVFVVFTGFAFVLPFLPLYVRELGVEDPEAAALWAGVLIGIAPLLAGLLAPAWGRLADRYGNKPMALRAVGASAILLALSALVTSAPQLLALRIGVGLFGGIGPLGLAMATALAPREQTGKAVGAIQAAQNLSAAVGPFAGGALADLIGFRGTFLVTAAICGIAFALLLVFYQEGPRATTVDAPPRGSFKEVLALPGLGMLLAILFLVNFIGRSLTPILPLQLQGQGVPTSRLGLATGVLISAYSVAAALSATGLGRASRNRSPRVLLAWSLSFGALAVVPLAVVSSFTAFLVLAIVLGLASGGALTLCYTIGGLSVPQRIRTSAFGFFSGAALFGGAISPSVAGGLAHFDLRAIYYLNGLLFLLLAAVVLFALRVTEQPPPEPAS